MSHPNSHYGPSSLGDSSLPTESSDIVDAGSRVSLSPGAGFLGFASHTDIFQEINHGLSQAGGLSPQQETGNLDQSTKQRVTFNALPPNIQSSCLVVLKCILSHDFRSLTSHDSPGWTRSWTTITVSSVAASVVPMLGPYQQEIEPRLEPIAERICNNTTRPLNDSSDAQIWMDQFTGPNMRWESLGLLWFKLNNIPNDLLSLRHSKEKFEDKDLSKALALEYLSHCVDLSRHFNEANDLQFALCRQKSNLESVIFGDACLTCWHSHGENVALMTYLGLHADMNTAPYKPSLCVEYKRRLFASLYHGDKMNVAFTGRPPLIGRRFCTTPLPLDLDDEQLAADEATRMQAVTLLNEHGWNTSGTVSPATVFRARCLMAYIMDEVIEVAFEGSSDANLAKLRILRAREMELASNFPSGLVYDPDELFSPYVDTDILFAKIVVRLSHLQNLFLIDRQLLCNDAADEGDLLGVAFELVTLSVLFWTHKDRFVNIRQEFEWLLMAYAAPGGGVLCLELLKPTFQGAYPKNPRLTRSSMIQQLSLVVGFLEWVRPSAPNGKLCASCKVIIQRVLDHCLNQEVDSSGTLIGFDPSFIAQPRFGFDLLNTFDWL